DRGRFRFPGSRDAHRVLARDERLYQWTAMSRNPELQSQRPRRREMQRAIRAQIAQMQWPKPFCEASALILNAWCQQFMQAGDGRVLSEIVSSYHWSHCT